MIRWCKYKPEKSVIYIVMLIITVAKETFVTTWVILVTVHNGWGPHLDHQSLYIYWEIPFKRQIA